MNLFKKSVSLILALLMVLSMVYLAPAEHVHAATASDYIKTTYGTHLSVKTNKVTNLHIYPTSGSTAKHTLSAGTMLTVNAMYENTAGEYWYKVLYYNATYYINASTTDYVSHLVGDVTATDLMTPAAIGYGSSFPLKGTIKSSLNKIGKVTAAVYKSSNITAAATITASATVNGKSYSLGGSTVDNNMTFGSLAAGSYTFLLSCTAVGYFLNSSGELSTTTSTVVLDNKPLVVSDPNSPNKIIAKGIDVSTWQGNIDWSAASKEIDFAILRLGYSTSTDGQFHNNAAGCNTYGVPFGVYHYSYALTEAEAIAEANYVISVLSSYKVHLPVFLDFEDPTQVNLPSSTKTAIVKAFCSTIENAGYQPGFYTFLSWFNSYFTDSYFSSMPKWIAQINSTCTYTKGVTMWQYSWTGSVSGISGDVDMNYYYGEFPNKSTDISYLSKCTYYPSNVYIRSESTITLKTLPASSYSNGKSVPADTVVRACGLYKNAAGEYWYQVEYDGTVGYVKADTVINNSYRYDDLSIQNQVMASNINQGSGYNLTGELNSRYLKMGIVHAKVYAGEDTSASPVISSKTNLGKWTYNLYHSEVCNNLSFGSLSKGYYTYEVSVDVRNYYYNDGLKSVVKNIVVWTAPFTVGGAAITPPTTVCSHNAVTDKAVAATCTTTGLTEGSHCSLCSAVIQAQTVTPVLGHNYVASTIPATCTDYEKIQYKCSRCSSSYTEYPEGTITDWSTTKPTGVDESKIESQTQYRYSDYETITSTSAAVDGYTMINKAWIKSGSGTINYVKSWPAGFDTSNSLYTTYKNYPKVASETETVKTVIESDNAVGYIFYHWCKNSYMEGPINRLTSSTKTDTYHTFHAFYTTTDPSTLNHDPAYGDYEFSNGDCCKDSYWYYMVEVCGQSYTTYKASYTHERWTDFSAWSETAVTTSDTRKVETRTVYRYATAELGAHQWVNGVCSACQKVCTHTWGSGKCSECGSTCEHSWNNGECGKCGTICAHTWSGGTCAVCGTVCSHSWENGICSICSLACTHTWSNGVCTNCAVPCAHAWADGTCGTCGTVCSHNWSNGICATCGLGCEHSWSDGVCTNCNLTCGHEWHNGICDICSKICVHTWNGGSCVTCGIACDHKWENGVCTVCTMACSHNWVTDYCEICGIYCTHTYENGFCTGCGLPAPTTDYYLFGFINGADYGCEADYKNTGEYIFVDGQLVATFEADSYVAIKTGGNEKWYMLNEWLGNEVTSATLYNTTTGSCEKLFVPGGVEVTFTLTVNDDDTLQLSYTTKATPTITLNSPSLALEEQIQYNIYYTISDMGSIAPEDMGLIGWSTPNQNGTIENAEYITPGAFRSGTRYIVHSDGIPAKELGDSRYFKVYAKQSNGAYVYSSIFRFSAKLYAEVVLANSTDTVLNQVCVSMLNYGAAAQEYFNYKPYSLMNAGLTDEQKALVNEYSSGMVSPMTKVDSNKAGSFTSTPGGFTSKLPSVSLEGAFAINYYFKPANPVDGDMTFYYWDPKTYETADVLTAQNALGTSIMSVDETGSYWASYEGIAAKEMNSTVFVAAVYESDGVTYCTGILACSVAAVSLMQMSSGTEALTLLTEDMLVYGYYAEAYFGSN